MRTKADDDRAPKKPPNPELDAFRAEIFKVLEYYADKKHYEPFQTLGGPRPAGVLTEGGDLARRTIAKHWPDEEGREREEVEAEHASSV
jgi:hypothetical protein